MFPAGATAAQGQKRYVFAQAPILVYWEMTRACDLACAHCRASAIGRRDPAELSTFEGKTLLRSIRGFGPRPPHVVMTGGDAMRRPDLMELIEYAAEIGVPVALAPSATPLLTADVLQGLVARNVAAISLSIDGPDASLHDGIRQVPGCWEMTISALKNALAAGLKVQVNTLVTASTLPELPRVYDLLSQFPIMRWSLFFLIQVGRGADLAQIAPEESEHFCIELADRMRAGPFEMKATELPHYRRVAVQRMLARGMTMAQINSLPLGRGFGIRDGNGVMFISHTGDVSPSGFLPLKAGNVLEHDVTDIYRNSGLFKGLRDPDTYAGKCGRCEYRTICGGSRARAYAATGDPFASDPLCPYEPKTPAAI